MARGAAGISYGDSCAMSLDTSDKQKLCRIVQGKKRSVKLEPPFGNLSVSRKLPIDKLSSMTKNAHGK